MSTFVKYLRVCVCMFLIGGCGLACAGDRQSSCHGEDKEQRRPLCPADWRRGQPQVEECESLECSIHGLTDMRNHSLSNNGFTNVTMR